MTRIFFMFIMFMGMSSVMANDKSFYGFKWLDDDETVYVIQNKEYPKSQRVGVDLSYVKSDNSAYQNSSGLVGALTYYFNEDYSIDFTYKLYSNSNNRDLDSLLNDKNTKPLVRTIDNAMLVHFSWIPFYGKLNTLNKIIYMDWGIGFGGGKFQTKSNYKTFLDQGIAFRLQPEDNYGFNIRTFFKFYMTRKWNFGVQYDTTGIKAITSATLKEEVIFFNDILLTLGFMF